MKIIKNDNLDFYPIHPSQSHAAVPEDTPRPAPYPAQPRPGERCNLRNACLGSALVPQIWLGN